MQSKTDTSDIIGYIFTNSNYIVRKEDLCYAYQVTEINGNTVLAVPLKLDVITSPQSKRISHMSQCGSKKLYEPLEIIGEPVIFTISNFGKDLCIKNNLLCLIECDYYYTCESPIWTTVDNNWDIV